MRKLGLLVSILLVVASSAMANNASKSKPERWTWQLPAARYRELNVAERAQYDKARRLFEKRQYSAAKSEFEKFEVQFPASSLIPYTTFMRGYCLHRGKDRNTAIAVYKEVGDFYPGEVADAAPAMYHIGLAQLDNGDEKPGLETMKRMVEHPTYRQHALAAGALRRLAENHWKNRHEKEAVSYWKRVVDEFGESNPDESRAAANAVAAYYVRSGEPQSYETWRAADHSDMKQRLGIVKKLRWTADGFRDDKRRSGWVGYKAGDKQKTADMDAFYKYLQSREDVYKACNDHLGYYLDAISFLTSPYRNFKERKSLTEAALQTTESVADPKLKWKWFSRIVPALIRGGVDAGEIQDAIVKVSTYIASIKDQADRDAKYGFIVDSLMHMSLVDHARNTLNRIADPTIREWKRYALSNRVKDWAQAEKSLLALEKMGDAEIQNRALGARAELYKNQMKRYDDAIKLYYQLSAPPDTLWSIHDCYMRLDNLNKAITTLREIENSFPDEASKAAWRMVEACDRSGKNNLAVAAAQRLMKIYPKADESSKAHQFLEKFNIDAGGGLSDFDVDKK